MLLTPRPSFFSVLAQPEDSDPGDHQRGEEGKYVTHNSSLLVLSLAKPRWLVKGEVEKSVASNVMRET
jgi:hypothetical protein